MTNKHSWPVLTLSHLHPRAWQGGEPAGRGGAAIPGVGGCAGRLPLPLPAGAVARRAGEQRGAGCRCGSGAGVWCPAAAERHALTRLALSNIHRLRLIFTNVSEWVSISSVRAVKEERAVRDERGRGAKGKGWHGGRPPGCAACGAASSREGQQLGSCSRVAANRSRGKSAAQAL